MANLPPAFMSIETLSKQLDMSESTVRKAVKEGVLPKPVTICGCVRYEWSKVKAAIASLAGDGAQTNIDPFMEGVRNAAQN